MLIEVPFCHLMLFIQGEHILVSHGRDECAIILSPGIDWRERQCQAGWQAVIKRKKNDGSKMRENRRNRVIMREEAEGMQCFHVKPPKSSCSGTLNEIFTACAEKKAQLSVDFRHLCSFCETMELGMTHPGYFTFPAPNVKA